mgnify:CR=1 FL=1
MLKGYKRKYNIHNGVGYVYEFENGYGASVVKHDAVSYTHLTLPTILLV